MLWICIGGCGSVLRPRGTYYLQRAYHMSAALRSVTSHMIMGVPFCDSISISNMRGLPRS